MLKLSQQTITMMRLVQVKVFLSPQPARLGALPSGMLLTFTSAATSESVEMCWCRHDWNRVSTFLPCHLSSLHCATLFVSTNQVRAIPAWGSEAIVSYLPAWRELSVPGHGMKHLQAREVPGRPKQRPESSLSPKLPFAKGSYDKDIRQPKPTGNSEHEKSPPERLGTQQCAAGRKFHAKPCHLGV